ncbi:10374_t:CDS:2 [Funneliformis geosporum]|nr:10374_t:CDS:2 [Funneliformis geosporum]
MKKEEEKDTVQITTSPVEKENSDTNKEVEETEEEVRKVNCEGCEKEMVAKRPPYEEIINSKALYKTLVTVAEVLGLDEFKIRNFNNKVGEPVEGSGIKHNRIQRVYFFSLQNYEVSNSALGGDALYLAFDEAMASDGKYITKGGKNEETRWSQIFDNSMRIESHYYDGIVDVKIGEQFIGKFQCLLYQAPQKRGKHKNMLNTTVNIIRRQGGTFPQEAEK